MGAALSTPHEIHMLEDTLPAHFAGMTDGCEKYHFTPTKDYTNRFLTICLCWALICSPLQVKIVGMFYAPQKIEVYFL